MQHFRLYSFLAVLVVMSLAVTSACSTAPTTPATPAEPAVPSTTPVTTAPLTAPVTGTSDLVITKIWLDGLMVKYSIKNIGTADTPQTYTYLYVNDLMPTMGGSGFVDVLKPGEEKALEFSNYQWPYDQGLKTPEFAINVNPSGYIDLRLQNSKVKVCADANNEAGEAIETNNCRVMLFGMLWDYDLLRVSNLATWRNNDGDITDPGSERSTTGAHFQVPNADMEMTPQLEIIPPQVPQSWMQGTYGYFYSDGINSSAKTAAIQIPAKLHFVARVGLTSNATGSDGVTIKFGLKDLNDNMTWIASKKITTPGALENWDINLSDYEGQKAFILLRVEAGNSPVNDFTIWNQARLIQIND
ncbi:MAG: CARDB domain-containing protein [Dehalococcoidia bacterium]|jgi:hypothetical protein